MNLQIPQAGALVVTGSLQMANTSVVDDFRCADQLR